MIDNFLNAMRAHAQMSLGEKTTHRVGQVTAYDPNKYAVKVKMWPDTQESLGWIPLASTYVGNGWGLVAGPSIGDQVIIAFDREDQDAGVVVGRFFTDVEHPPAAPSGELWLVHKSGAFVKLTNDGKLTVNDKAGSTIVMNGDGTGTATFSGGLTINANSKINGTLLVTQTITGQGGIVISGNNGSGNASTVNGNTNFTGQVSANGHRIDDTHEHSGVQTGSGNSGPPL